MTKMQREECFTCESSELLECFKTMCAPPTTGAEGCNAGYELQLEVAMAIEEIHEQMDPLAFYTALSDPKLCDDCSWVPEYVKIIQQLNIKQTDEDQTMTYFANLLGWLGSMLTVSC